MKKQDRLKLIMYGAALILLLVLVITLFRMIQSMVIDTSYNGLGKAKIPKMNTLAQNGFYEKDDIKFYKKGDVSSVPGIDVSVFQKDIDWDKVYDAGIRFVMVRLGYTSFDKGNRSLDTKFEQNTEGALKAGLDVGCYYFSQASSKKEAIEEAKFVIKNLHGKKIKMPVAFDMENTQEKDRHEDLSKEERTLIADAFLTVIKNNGYKPMLYGNQRWIYSHIDYSKLTDYDLWLAHYSERTDFPFRYNMWQYSKKGKIDGISTDVDMNIWIKY